MANTLLKMINNNPMGNMMNMMKAIRSAQDPMRAIEQMAVGNPQLRQVMQVVSQSGGDARAAFYNMAQARGVDPEEILSQIRSMM